MRRNGQVANFAELIMREYLRDGGAANDLFVAFAGLVSAHDKILGAECLIALEAAVLMSGEGARPA